MRDIFEQLAQIFWIAIHHRWLVAFSAALICLVGWTVVYLLPDSYEVKTAIYFDAETALTPVLENIAIEDNSREERALIIQRRMTNHSTLVEIAQRSGKITEYDSEKAREKKLIKMHKNIKVASTKLNEYDEYAARSLFTISYMDNDPEIALSVVEVMTDLFIDNFIKTSRSESGQVEGFLDDKIQEYKANLEEAEENLKLFKQKHPNLTMAKGENFFSRLNELKSKVEEARLQLVEEENRNFTLRSQLNAVIADNRSSENAAYRARELSAIEKRIQDARQQLAELKLQFTEQHPDVLASERILRDLEAQKAVEDRNPSTNASARTNSLVQSELYQRLQLMMSESNSKVAALRARITEFQSKVDTMDAQANVMPEIEAELVRLTRDYTVNKETYEGLLQRKASSDISTQAELSNENMLYEILTPASLPSEPSFPDRKLFSTGILALALIGGVLFAWLMEQMRPTIYREKQLTDNLGLTVYGNVPMYWSNTEVASRRFGAVFYMLVISSLFVAYYYVMVKFGFSIEPFIEKYMDYFNQGN